VPLGFAGVLFALSLAPAVTASAPLANSFRSAAVLLALGAVVVGLRVRDEQRTLRLRFVPVRAHGVQTGVHVVLFTAWGATWDGVAAHVPHIAAQVLFFYAFDLLLAWWRHDEARTGLGPLPIVGSVNLFLWFRDDLFGLQFALIAVGVLAKSLVTWERDGRRTHVFNPSSFPLFLACGLLWAGGLDDRTFAREIAVSLGQVPHAWLLIFGLGLVVQTLFATTLVTLTSVAALGLANLAYTAATGVYSWVDVGIPASIFLGCNFLVTDPATSPRTARGRAVFGVLYGLAVFALYLVLREVEGPAWYDKLLCVPVLNLMVRRLDRLGGPPAAHANLTWVAVMALGFAALWGTGFLGPHHPGKSVAFWEEACREGRWHACPAFAELLDEACHDGAWPRCEEHAQLLLEGEVVPRDLSDAGYHLALACQEDVASACARVPGFLADGGTEALEAACADDDGMACLVLATFWLDPQHGPVAAEQQRRALERIERACALEVEAACAHLEG